MIAESEWPDRVRRLKRDPRGYPIPHFVAYINGEPNFRIADPKKVHDCIVNDHCWVCGEKLGQYKAFVIGPMCAVNRTTTEPPSHRECARFAVKVCPFLVNPKVLRVPDEKLGEGISKPAGTMIRRNPGVALIWICRGYYVQEYMGGKVLMSVGDPASLEWWAEGREATKEEILHSLETGLPFLKAEAEKDGPGSMNELLKRYDQVLGMVMA